MMEFKLFVLLPGLSDDLQWATDTGNASISTGRGAGRLPRRKGGIAMPACTVQSWGSVKDLKSVWCLTGNCWIEYIQLSSKKQSFKSKVIRQHLVSLLLPLGCKETFSEPWCGIWKPSCCWVAPLRVRFPLGEAVCRGTCAKLLLLVNLPNWNFLLWIVVVWDVVETRALNLESCLIWFSFCSAGVRSRLKSSEDNVVCFMFLRICVLWLIAILDLDFSCCW